MNESALLVAVPEAESLVGALRARFDPSAPLGVPAHVTVLYPFMPRERLTAAVLDRLRAALRGFAPFRFKLGRVARFPQTTYLAPEPSDPFVAMTAALVREFPEFPPYGGRFADVVPHLTVADGDAESAGIAERALAADLRQMEAVRADCRSVEVFENSADGRWRRFASLALGGG